jgi:hypothetical protein
MKQAMIIAVLMVSVGLAVAAETNSPVLKQGDLISRHLQNLAPFGDGKPLLATPAGQPGTTEVMMWKIGDGILTVTTSIGAGIIKEMSYIVRTDGGRGLPFEVKEFNPKTGEMTIRVPNKPSEATR